MKRSVTAFILLAAVTLPLKAQFTTTWERSAAGTGVPSWFSTTASTERGFAYGTVGVNERVYVASRNGGTFVRVLNADTGADVGTLDVTGVSGGTFAINDIEVSDDGVIMACNLTTDAVVSPFRCYTWASEAVAPTAVIVYTAAAADRLGDKVTLTGSCADNTATLFAASGNSTTVYTFSTGDNCASFAPTTVSVAASMGSTPDVVPDFSGSGGFYGTGSGQPVRAYSAAGAVNATATIVGDVTTALSSFSGGGRNYLGVFDHVAGNATVIDVTDGLAAATSYGATASLGANANGNGTGDVAVRNNGDGTFTVFVMETNNGLGAYTTNAAPLPVELVSFDGAANGSTATLRWTTASETNNAGFDVQRRGAEGFETLGFVAGHGTTLEAQNYVFDATGLTPGRHVFRLVQRDFDGATSVSPEVELTVNAGEALAFAVVQPNPARSTAQVSLYVDRTQSVTVAVYDMVGRQVAVLFDGTMAEGTTPMQVETASWPAGLYMLRATGERFSKTQQLTVIH